MKKLIFLFVFGFSTSAFGQNVLSLYNMKHIPQTVYANPSFIPLGRLNFSIPLLGSHYAQIGKSDFGTEINPSGIDFNTETFLNSLKDENSVFGTTDIELLHVGFTIGKNYIFVNATDKVRSEFGFPKEMAIFISEVYQDTGINNPINISNPEFQYTHAREYGIGWARVINEKLNVGVRAKMLMGISNFRTNSLQITATGENSQGEIVGTFNSDVHTSGIETYFENPTELIYATNNLGFSFDVGSEYDINEHFTVALSVLDIGGTINWKSEVKHYNDTDEPFAVQTIDWDDISTAKGAFNEITNFFDTLVSQSDYDSTTTYSTTTPTKILGSISYKIRPKLEATLLSETVFHENHTEAYLRIGIQGRIKRFLNYMVSYAIIDDNVDPTNLGLGFAVNFGAVQIHALTDNIFDPFLFTTSYSPSLRFGVNITVGRDNE